MTPKIIELIPEESGYMWRIGGLPVYFQPLDNQQNPYDLPLPPDRYKCVIDQPEIDDERRRESSKRMEQHRERLRKNPGCIERSRLAAMPDDEQGVEMSRNWTEYLGREDELSMEDIAELIREWEELKSLESVKAGMVCVPLRYRPRSKDE